MWAGLQDWAGDNLIWPRYPEALWAEPGFRVEQETTLPDHVILRLCELSQESGLSRRHPYLTTLSRGFVSWARIQDWAGDNLTWPRYPEALWAEPGVRTEQETTLPDHVILRLCELNQEALWAEPGFMILSKLALSDYPRRYGLDIRINPCSAPLMHNPPHLFLILDVVSVLGVNPWR